MNKKLLLTAAIAASLVGCGGSGTPSERPAAQIDGTAADNIIRNGQVRVYRWDGQEREILLTTKTDNHGYYADPLRSESQFIKVCITSGEYTEEASSINIKLENGDRLCAVTFWESAQPQEIMVTPETNLATALMEYEVKTGKGNLQNIVSGANSKIGTLFGYDILTTKPADMTSDDLAYTGLNDSVRSGLWHAAFSRLALQAAKKNGHSTHTSLINSMQLHKALYRDLSADGKLDGWGLAENGKTKIRLGLGSYELNAQVYRTELARELVNFVQSDRNKTAVKSNDVLSYANTFSVTTDSIFDEKDLPVPFDTDAPKVAFDTPENTYIANTYVLGVSVTDFSGVKSVTYTINGGNEQVFDFSQDKLTINTKSYADGDLELALTVVDKLDNTAVVKRVLKVSNAKPVVNIASKTLVNNTNYSFIADVGEVKAGVARVEVNSKTADFDNNKIISSVRLQEGTNAIAVKIVDLAAAEHTYTYNVIADTRTPIVEFTPLSWNYLVKNNTAVSYGSHSSNRATSPKTFITPSYYRLGALLATENSLATKNWPTFKITVNDPKTLDSYATLPENLNIELTYSDTRKTRVYSTRTLQADEKGVVLIPLSDEYLNTGWHEKDDGKLLSIKTTDEAGNTNLYDIEFEIAVSAPKLSPTTVKGNLEGAYLRGNSFEVYLNGTDLEGVDEIRFVLDGATETFVPWNTTIYTLDTTVLSDGIHYLNTYISTGGEQLFSERYEFFVDNTPPKIEFTSKQLVNAGNKNYTLKGTINDFSGSGVSNAWLSLNDASYSNLQQLQSFERTLSLQSGDNTILIKAEDIAGNETVKSLQVLLDDDKPKFQQNISNGKQVGSFKEDLFDRDFNILVGYTHAPDVADMYDVFKGSKHPLYLDNNNNNLENITAALVGGNVNALNADGSLNLSDPSASIFLRNGRGGANQAIPHFHFVVSDSQYGSERSGDKKDSVVNATTLNTYLTVTVKGDTFISKRLLQPVFRGVTTSTQEYFVPITKEIFSDRLLELAIDDSVDVLFTIEDEAGNITEKTYSFHVFNAPHNQNHPVVTGGLNTTFTKDSIKLDLTANSTNGLSLITLNGETLFDSKGKSQRTTSFSAPTKTVSANGVYSWVLDVVDLAGNSTKKLYSGEIDKIAPVIQTMTYPNAVDKDFETNWVVSDKNLKTVTIDGKNYSAASGKAIVTVSNVADGRRSFSVVVRDKAGNTTTQNYYYDNKYNERVAKSTAFFTTDMFGYSTYCFGSLSFTLVENKLNDKTFKEAGWGQYCNTAKYNFDLTGYVDLKDWHGTVHRIYPADFK